MRWYWLAFVFLFLWSVALPAMASNFIIRIFEGERFTVIPGGERRGNVSASMFAEEIRADELALAPQESVVTPTTVMEPVSATVSISPIKVVLPEAVSKVDVTLAEVALKQQEKPAELKRIEAAPGIWFLAENMLSKPATKPVTKPAVEEKVVSPAPKEAQKAQPEAVVEKEGKNIKAVASTPRVDKKTAPAKKAAVDKQASKKTQPKAAWFYVDGGVELSLEARKKLVELAATLRDTKHKPKGVFVKLLQHADDKALADMRMRRLSGFMRQQGVNLRSYRVSQLRLLSTEAQQAQLFLE